MCVCVWLLNTNLNTIIVGLWSLMFANNVNGEPRLVFYINPHQMSLKFLNVDYVYNKNTYNVHIIDFFF